MARNFSDKTFTKILRGYSPDEVKEYIQYIDNEYKKLERVSADNVRKLALALRKLDEMNNYAEQLEKQIEEQSLQLENSGKAQVDYEELARLKNETIVHAKNESEAILADAREKSGSIITEAREQGETIVTEAEDLARSVRDKIITEAVSKAESIIKEAQIRTEETRRSAETMGAAALKMYGEVLSFRDTLFEAYNIHIESIEEIIETADELFGDEEETETEESDAIAEENEPESAPVTEEYEEDELLGAVDISEYGEMLQSLEEEAGELEIDMSEFREIIDDLPMSEAASALEDDFVVVGDSEDVESDPTYEESDSLVSTEEAYEEKTAEEYDEVEEPEAPVAEAEDEWISAEEWDAENSGDYTEDYAVEAEQYIVDNGMDDEAEDEPAEDVSDYVEEISEGTYESYGNIDAEEEIDPIELEAQKYSDVYPIEDADESDEGDFYTAEALEDEEDYPDYGGDYAPAPEYSWGDDMYVEPEGEEEYTDEYSGEYTAEYSEEYDEDFDGEYDEDFDDDVEFMEELPAAPVYDEEDELDRLKQFFSADFDEAARRREYDTTSNSTTSIALSLNDFFDEGEDGGVDFGYNEDDMESLFEKRRDMSVTDEFDIVFGNSDSAKSVAEIRRQPMISPEKPGKHKKQKNSKRSKFGE